MWMDRLNDILEAIDNLKAFVKDQGRRFPTGEVKIAEIDPELGAAPDGRILVQRSRLATPQAYRDRFEQLCTQGFPWINVSLMGQLGTDVIVSVEVPLARRTDCPACSLNYSGPTRGVLENGGNAEIALKLVN